MLTQRIDTYLRNRPRPDRQKGVFHCSDLHLPISRLVSLYINGSNERFPAQTLRIFDCGTFLEKRLLQYLDEILISSNVPVEDPSLELVGEVDALIELNGKEFVLEVKSINSRGFQKLRQPPKAHLWQVQGYLRCSGIEQAILLYENKDSQEFREFHIPVDPVIQNEIAKKLKQCRHIISRLTNQDALATYTDMLTPRATRQTAEPKPRITWEELQNSQPKGFFALLQQWVRYFRSGLAT